MGSFGSCRSRTVYTPLLPLLLIFASTFFICALSSDPGLDQPYGTDYANGLNPNYTRLANGQRNNLAHPTWGAANTPYRAITVPHNYSDGISAPARINGTSARVISNKLFSRLPSSNKLLTNDLQTIWGQLIVLDICNTLRGPNLLLPQYNALRGGRNYSIEEFGIHVPTDDIFLNPNAEADVECPIERSAPWPPTLDGGVREQFMDITAWIDGSWLYGTSGRLPPVAGSVPFSWNLIRENGGTSCKLNNTFWMAPPSPTLKFTPNSVGPVWKMRGDIRTNKTPDLIALTEVFGLEHNRLCDEFAIAHPDWNQDRLFHESRKWVIAFLQKISTREWLAAEMGTPLNSTTYSQNGYDPNVDPRIENFFCSVAFRYGHSQVNTHIPLLDDQYQESESLGNVLIRDWYFEVKSIIDRELVAPILRGLTATRQGLVDTSFVDDVRNYMFSTPIWNQNTMHICGDLAATNIQRGRDHGMPSYNDARRAVGLEPMLSWADNITDPAIRAILEEVYPDGPETADPYVIGLLEEHVTGAHVGPLFHASIMDQFERLRNGDRFWYERKGMFTDAELAIIYQTTLMDIVSRNLNLTKWGTVPGETFYLKQRYLANIGGDQFFQHTGEYQFFIDLSPAYRLSWTPVRESNVVHMMIQCRNSGWVGVGFLPDNGTMKNADIHICHRLDNGAFEVLDAYALDVGKPTVDTTLPGGSDDINIYPVNATYADGVVTCRFTRKITTSDPWDKSIPEGLVKVIFAFHPNSNDLIYHGPTRSSAARLNILNTCMDASCMPKSSDDTGAIIGGVLGGLAGLLLLLLIIAIILLLLARKKKKEEQLLLAEQWSDDEADIEMDELTSESNGFTKSADSAVLLRRLSMADLETSNITFEPKVLTFGLGSNDKCPVDKEVSDEFVITNHGPTRKFTFFVPAENDKFSCRLFPGSGVIRSGRSVTIHVHMTLLMTTNIERKIKFDIEGLGSYLIDVKLVGELSVKLDPDDIITVPPPIGQGSFGTVYKAVYRGQEVAAKILNSQMDRRLIEEFHKEVDIMTRLRCPYVLNFVGASFVPGKICLVTELCTQGSVSDAVFSDRNFNYLLVLKVALDMAKAIAFLHANGVLHRDVKPDNFLLVSLSSKAPVSCKIADFGTSRSITQAREAFNHTAALGTPIYMAPEILDHKPYSAKIDVYSFAIMLWVLYTRREPYTEMKRQWDIPKAVLKGYRPPIPEHCPQPFADLIIQCWAGNPDERPEMSEVASVLEKLFEEEKTLKGERDEAKGTKRSKQSDRAQTARNFDAEEEEDERERLGARTWQGREGLVRQDDASDQQPDMSSDDDDEKGKKTLASSADKGKGKELKDKRNLTGGL